MSLQIHYLKVYFKFRVRKFMKLFKSLLVAPATLGLLAPMSATANEVTVNDFNPVIEETLLAGGEGLVEDSYDGGFSETTSASFSVDTVLGAIDGASSETTSLDFQFNIGLSTSFTGEDSLDIATVSYTHLTLPTIYSV